VSKSTIVWLLVTLGLSAPAVGGNGPIELSSEDYAVYAAVLRWPPFIRDRSALIIFARTAVHDPSFCDPNPQITRSAPYQTAMADYVKKCGTSAPLQARFGSTLREQLLSYEDREAIFHGPHGTNAGWDRFRTKWPGARGFFELSRVGFSPDGKRAFVLVTEYCGVTCGRATYFPVENDGTTWHLGTGILAGQPRLE